jgi:hypothetical protein
MLGSRVSPSKRTLPLMLCGALALALGGCEGGGLGGGALHPTQRSGGAAVQGGVEANGTALGSFEAAVSVCTSGARQHFFGVDLYSPERDTEVRVVMDPMGRAELRVRRAEQPRAALLLNSSNCAHLEVGLDHGSWAVNDIQEVRGVASFDCELASGGRVKGELTFSRCH